MLTELFVIEQIICIKVDLALNNQQRLICHKTRKPINQSTNHLSIHLIPFIPLSSIRLSLYLY